MALETPENETPQGPSFFTEQFRDLTLFAEDAALFTVMDVTGTERHFVVPNDIPFPAGARFSASYSAWAKAQDAQLKSGHPNQLAKREKDYERAFDAVMESLLEILSFRNPGEATKDGKTIKTDAPTSEMLRDKIGHQSTAMLLVSIAGYFDPSAWLTKFGLLMGDEPGPKAPAQPKKRTRSSAGSARSAATTPGPTTTGKPSAGASSG